jgi:predicted aminopeptidase
MVTLRPLILLLPLLLTGCTTLGYYAQSIQGQLDLLGRRHSIEQMIANADTPDGLRKRLQLVLEMREFASHELGLPDNGSYRSYADLQRSAMVWSVVATPEFSMQPRQWCYPVVGCASYRGYFKKVAAEGFAEGLRGRGLDVVVESIPAYSTLGWFDDPLPSTVVYWPEPRLAGLIFHELAHQRLYFPGDSDFNEGFASVVAQVGVERWLRSRGDAGSIDAWRQSLGRQQAFVDLLLEARERLIALYAGPLPEQAMRQTKAEVFSQLREGYADLKQRWGGYPGYDDWFSRELNNAHLASVATYQRLMPALLALLQRGGDDLAVFYAACDELKALEPGERAARLDPPASNRL